MGKGKIAAQCAHAAVDLYRQLTRGTVAEGVGAGGGGQGQEVGGVSPLLLQWEANGEAKIVVGVDNADELLALVAAAGSTGSTAEHEAVASTIISDAGRCGR